MPEPHRPEGSPLLKMTGIRCGYGASEVIHDVSLAVARREVVCLIGPNGAGKSTLINALFGLIPTSAGAIEFDGCDLGRSGTAMRVGMGLALVPEGRGVLPGLSVEDNLLLGGYARRREATFSSRFDDVLAVFPILAQRRAQIAGTLSGGEQQMLVIARALMGRPALLVLDEPSFGLAPKMVGTIFDVIAKLQQSGIAVLLVEQNAHLALQISQRGYVIESGRCVLTDSAMRLRESTLVREVYLGSG